MPEYVPEATNRWFRRLAEDLRKRVQQTERLGRTSAATDPSTRRPIE